MGEIVVGLLYVLRIGLLCALCLDDGAAPFGIRKLRIPGSHRVTHKILLDTAIRVWRDAIAPSLEDP
jgi:hypothetical protein